MVEPHMVRVLGRSAFHDTALTVSGDLCYLGGEVYFILSPFSFSVLIAICFSLCFLKLLMESKNLECMLNLVISIFWNKKNL